MFQFSRRQYVWLASFARDHIRAAKTRSDLWDAHECARLVVFDLADALAAENPSGFDRVRFLHNSLCDPTHHKASDCPFSAE